MSDDSVGTFVEFDAAVRTVPFRCTAGHLGETDAVQMEPFSVTVWVLAADHCSETDVPADTVTRLIRVDLFKHAVLINADILPHVKARLPWPYSFFARLGLAASIAYSGTPVRAV